jgi:DNA-binding transcriptional ArsR family regulator
MPNSRKPTIDRVFHALGDPTRRALLALLTAGPLSVSGLATPLKITLTAVSQHVRALEQAGLVTTRKAGRVRTCQLAPQGFALLERWIRQLRAQWERRLDRFGALLQEEDA